MHPTKEKVKAIHEAPVPTSKQELQAFLRLLNFYCIFLRKRQQWPSHYVSYLTKRHGGSGRLFMNKFSTNASSCCPQQVCCTIMMKQSPLCSLVMPRHKTYIKAVLGRRPEDDKEVPVAFYSRTLTSTKPNYVQINKEAFAVLASVKKFHDYTYCLRDHNTTNHLWDCSHLQSKCHTSCLHECCVGRSYRMLITTVWIIDLGRTYNMPMHLVASHLPFQSLWCHLL